ncbi:MAG: tetratricopeptide repeat protein [Acidobacteriaceae bacterium]
MDTQTRRALKQDKFVTATTSGLEWVGANRSNVVRWSIAVVVAIGLIVAGVLIYEQRTSASEALLGQAMDIYQTPLAQPDVPQEPGQKTYASAADRARAACPLFQQAADQYGWLHAGEMARYFAGVTELDLNQTAQAEADLEKASHAHDSGVAALAKLALANVYTQTGRTSQAASLFNDLIQHPTTTVPKAQAQLQLALMYETTNPEEAKRIYAEIKDQDKDSDAAQIASQKLQTLK